MCSTPNWTGYARLFFFSLNIKSYNSFINKENYFREFGQCACIHLKINTDYKAF